MVIERGPGRPPNGYAELAGFEIPSVTEVLDIVGEKEGLCRHFADLGLYGFIDRDRKAEVGNRVHAAIEATIHGDPQERITALLEPSLESDPLAHRDRSPEDGEQRRAEMRQWSWNSYGAWLEWWQLASFDLEPIATETPVVHRDYRITKSKERSRVGYAGTPDMVAWYTPRPGERRRVVVDWKTTRELRPNSAAQAGAYGVAWEHGEVLVGGELTKLGDRIDGALLVRAGRDGSVTTLFLEGHEWDAAKRMWASARALFAYRGALKSRVDAANERSAKERKAAAQAA